MISLTMLNSEHSYRSALRVQPVCHQVPTMSTQGLSNQGVLLYLLVKSDE